MIGIDTNVLVRYIVQDDPVQSELATAALESQCTAEEPGRICLIVLCELVWVLRRAYGYEKQQIISIVRDVLLTTEFQVQQSELAFRALNDFEKGSADFSDYLIGYLHQAAEAETTLTFDKKAGAHSLFHLLKKK